MATGRPAFDPATLKQAARLAHRWGGITRPSSPLPVPNIGMIWNCAFRWLYHDEVVANAKADAMDPAWIYAVIRQESAFRADARSRLERWG